jgi:PadR family transcriptional regulator AphA
MAGENERMRLTPMSYVVMGLLAANGRSTPYELKRLHRQALAQFWTMSHAQLYAEPERLARGGLLRAEQERHGRRRRVYEITSEGRAAFEAWLATPAVGTTAVRDVGLLQLFFGADPAGVARRQEEVHADRLAAYERLTPQVGAMPLESRLVLKCAIGQEREWIRFWASVRTRPKVEPGAAQPRASGRHG